MNTMRHLFFVVIPFLAFAGGAAEASQITLAPNTVGIINGRDCQPKIPEHARRYEFTGKTVIFFKYNEKGVIYSAAVNRSSGDTEMHKLLDDGALSAVFSCRIGVVNPNLMPAPDAKGFFIRPLQFSSGEGMVEFVFDIADVRAPSADFTTEHKYPLPSIQASSWRPVGSLQSRQKLLLHTDIERGPGDTVRFWILFSSDMEVLEPSSIIRLHEIDCRSRQLKILQMTYFRRPMAAGPHLNVLAKEMPLPNISPRTAMAAVETLVCARN